jgi:hypothetical protein
MNGHKRHTLERTKREKKMVQLERFRWVLRLAAIVLLDSSLLWAGENVISKVPSPTGEFCHLKFPAIKEETLYWNRPVLKDPSQGDTIDFYGPCSHDPLGKEEIRRQRDDFDRRQRRLPESEGA